MRSHYAALFLFFVLAISIPDLAFAYIDPGSGSFIIQMVVASAAGISYVLRAYITRFVYFIKYDIFGISKKEQSSTIDTIDSDESI